MVIKVVYVCGGVSEEPKETDTNLPPPMTQPYILCIYLAYLHFFSLLPSGKCYTRISSVYTLSFY